MDKQYPNSEKIQFEIATGGNSICLAFPQFYHLHAPAFFKVNSLKEVLKDINNQYKPSVVDSNFYVGYLPNIKTFYIAWQNKGAVVPYRVTHDEYYKDYRIVVDFWAIGDYQKTIQEIKEFIDEL